MPCASNRFRRRRAVCEVRRRLGCNASVSDSYLVQQEQPATGEVVAPLHHGRHVLPVWCQFANFEPDQHVDFGVDVSCRGGGQSAEFGGTYGLGYGDGGRLHPSRRLPHRSFQFGVLVQGVLLVVSEDLEHYRLRLDVVQERFRDANRDLLMES